jgi:DUF4097 and DUF4098 domain-containing protein YvlB
LIQSAQKGIKKPSSHRWLLAFATHGWRLIAKANIFVDKVEGAVLIPKAASSNIEIKHAVSDVKISTISGDVKVGEMNADVEISTENGNITCLINSTATSIVKLITISGDIDARFRKIDGAANITTQKGDIRRFKSQSTLTSAKFYDKII